MLEKKDLVPPKWIIQYNPCQASHVKAADDITEKKSLLRAQVEPDG